MRSVAGHKVRRCAEPGQGSSGTRGRALGGNSERALQGWGAHPSGGALSFCLQALFTLEYKAKINPALTKLIACMRSEPG